MSKKYWMFFTSLFLATFTNSGSSKSLHPRILLFDGISFYKEQLEEDKGLEVYMNRIIPV